MSRTIDPNAVVTSDSSSAEPTDVTDTNSLAPSSTYGSGHSTTKATRLPSRWSHFPSFRRSVCTSQGHTSKSATSGAAFRSGASKIGTNWATRGVKKISRWCDDHVFEVLRDLKADGLRWREEYNTAIHRSLERDPTDLYVKKYGERREC